MKSLERLGTVFELVLNAVIVEKNYSNDNYNLVYSDTMIITTTFAHCVTFDLLTELGSTYEDCGPEDSNGVCKLLSWVLFS